MTPQEGPTERGLGYHDDVQRKEEKIGVSNNNKREVRRQFKRIARVNDNAWRKKNSFPIMPVKGLHIEGSPWRVIGYNVKKCWKIDTEKITIQWGRSGSNTTGGTGFTQTNRSVKGPNRIQQPSNEKADSQLKPRKKTAPGGLKYNRNPLKRSEFGGGCAHKGGQGLPFEGKDSPARRNIGGGWERCKQSRQGRIQKAAGWKDGQRIPTYRSPEDSRFDMRARLHVARRKDCRGRVRLWVRKPLLNPRRLSGNGWKKKIHFIVPRCREGGRFTLLGGVEIAIINTVLLPQNTVNLT